MLYGDVGALSGDVRHIYGNRNAGVPLKVIR
jgi:hypothetical protein